jgi:hypothetical protein
VPPFVDVAEAEELELFELFWSPPMFVVVGADEPPESFEHVSHAKTGEAARTKAKTVAKNFVIISLSKLVH